MDIKPDNQLSFPAILQDGAVIAGIIAVWGLFALLGLAIGNIGPTGTSTYTTLLGDYITHLFLLVGALNAVVYALARALILSRAADD